MGGYARTPYGKFDRAFADALSGHFADKFKLSGTRASYMRMFFYLIPELQDEGDGKHPSFAVSLNHLASQAGVTVNQARNFFSITDEGGITRVVAQPAGKGATRRELLLYPPAESVRRRQANGGRADGGATTDIPTRWKGYQWDKGESAASKAEDPDDWMKYYM